MTRRLGVLGHHRGRGRPSLPIRDVRGLDSAQGNALMDGSSTDANCRVGISAHGGHATSGNASSTCWLGPAGETAAVGADAQWREQQTWLNRHMEMGERWAYRARPKDLGSAVRQVEIVRVGGPDRPGWFHVRFLEGDAAGLQEWISSASLVAPWADVDTFRAGDAAELALAESSRHVRGGTDFEAARMILGFVGPKNRLRVRRTVPDAGVLELSRLDETAPLIGLEAAELRSDAMVHENRHGMCLAGWPVTERVARHVAGRLADEILPEVDRKQQGIEYERAQSSWYSYSRRDDRKLDAEAAVLRTVRAWCGEDKAYRYDELVALRAEVIRLGELVGEAVKALLDRGHGVIASTIERDLGVHIATVDPDVRR